MKVTIERPAVEVKREFTVGELLEWQTECGTEQYVVMVTDPKSSLWDDGFAGVVLQSTCPTWSPGVTDEIFIYSEFTPFKGKLIIEV